MKDTEVDNFSVPAATYRKALENLNKEVQLHAQTRQDLRNTKDALELANEEISFLKQQLELERVKFKGVLRQVQGHTLAESSRNAHLENKCHNIQLRHDLTEDTLLDEKAKVISLTSKLRTQEADFSSRLSDLELKLQQEAYINRLLQEK